MEEKELFFLSFTHTYKTWSHPNFPFSISPTITLLPHPGLLSPLLYASSLYVYVVLRMEETKEVMQIMEDTEGKSTSSPPPMS